MQDHQRRQKQSNKPKTRKNKNRRGTANTITKMGTKGWKGGRQTERETDRQTEGWKGGRSIDGEKETDRQRHTETEREV